ncbi:M16 family metallopeptidase [Adhaeribacter radiodurans]|uniref:Insulinase family protein n=1 Tax=Adhaeribacter radiodurans TaxID=2745197 RepID=A0A7L7LAN2_9BACT|nr:pitrilysin family protein [Adhaeribacter radiodurans]QMU29813.1 insulinase family protein [Adhaeribacter radiodurans]
MRKTFTLSIILCLFIGTVQAQLKLPPNMFFQKLPNGLEMLVVEDHTVPMVTIEIACKNGSFTETPEFNGLSHLYEHLFFKANKDYPNQIAYHNRVNELDIDFNGTTREELVNYYFSLPKENLVGGLKFMNSAIRYPKFKKQDMLQENEIVNAEFQRKESNPYYALKDAVDRHLWGDLYSRKHVIGDHNIILTATPDKMEVIKDKYYYPNNSVLVIAGDINHEKAFAEANKVFGSWSASKFDPFQKWPVPEFKPLTKTDYFVVESDIAQVPSIMFSWHGPDTRNDVAGTFAADVFSFIVNQQASRLFESLEASGLALSTGVNYYTQKYVGPITFYVTPNPDRIQECLAEMKKQIALWDSEDYFTDKQIERAKRLLAIEQVQQNEITEEYAHTLSFWWASSSVNYYTTYQENLNKVTKADLQAYVRKYIKNKPYCAGLLINSAMSRELKPTEFFKEN